MRTAKFRIPERAWAAGLYGVAIMAFAITMFIDAPAGNPLRSLTAFLACIGLVMVAIACVWRPLR